jgi:sugar phosphate isomerase/epimerase
MIVVLGSWEIRGADGQDEPSDNAPAVALPARPPAPEMKVHRPMLPNPFYAMDAAFRRPGLTDRQQYELVKELGFAGVAWHEGTPAQVQGDLYAIEARGLRMFAIYCPAKITPDGDLSYSQTLEELMKTLSGHGTIIWLHIGGKGSAFESLTGEEPVVAKLRALAGLAERYNLRIAIYPHLGEWTARFGDATRLAKLVNHPRFGVTFNLCHALAAGEEAEIPALLEQAKDVLFTVTLCGAQAGVTGGKWDQLIQTLEKGTFDVGLVLRKLRQIGFTGPVGFQGYGIEGDARAILTPTMKAWRELSAAAAAHGP